MSSVEDVLRRHNYIAPGFNLLRHALALAILVHHCRVAVFGLFGNAELIKDSTQPGMAVFMPKASGDPGYEALKGAGIFAFDKLTAGQIVTELLRPGLYSLVGMFFILSGFLVAGSALKNPHLPTFISNRILRIVPALSVEVTLSALVLGVVFTSLPLNQYFSDGQFFRYFGNIVGHVTFELPGVFEHNPWPAMINANLWTLPWELWCYIIMVGLMLAGAVRIGERYLKFLMVAVPVLLLIVSFFDLASPGLFSTRQDTTRYAGWYIVLLFTLGVFMRLVASKVPVRFDYFVLAVIGYCALTLTNFLTPFSGLFLAYITVYLGMARFGWFDKLMPYDISYGIYLYGFPITQAAIAVVLPHFEASRLVDFAIILPIVILFTALFACLSWIYVERPVLRLRHYYQKPVG